MNHQPGLGTAGRLRRAGQRPQPAVQALANYCASPAQYEHLITLTARDSAGQIGTDVVRVRGYLLC
ncbi:MULTISPECIES: hypothetical protein [unclassified Meiothermus]|uniref:hypothetical protein n=1 Tax=unclassified Meiothermus TaxID=370471 RepID=UPI000D7C5ABB|nr:MULTISPECIES: hypothetical protein [unclassified Meiothermus]PZA06201.1 hypothetical protein DNA98_14650 [Meiothermus sp. Pnk-1]RYM37464.1 hypothetical protein EWH23_06075 [Meiothermus sp. PNK-Is4]